MYATESELVWLAAAIDAEGTISFTFQSKKKDGKTYFVFVPTLHLSNQCKEFCEKALLVMRKIAGSGHIHKRPSCYTARCHSALSVLRVLKAIYPYLIVKRRHADLLIEVIESRLKRAGYTSGNVRRLGFTKYEKQLLIELRKLQKKTTLLSKRARDLATWLKTID